MDLDNHWELGHTLVGDKEDGTCDSGDADHLEMCPAVIVAVTGKLADSAGAL